MGKIAVTCILVIVFTISLYDRNVLASGAEVVEGKISYAHCHPLCTDYYGWFQCLTDCLNSGFAKGGECVSPSPKDPKKCCCKP
ncbi:hypothetical protein CARUB_v10015077mg [Capsella rubella]|uniref:Defensin-like domain-containing protein n=1 Tax=Capsella rubella TaxID=81985 RepID=R0I1R6_9BRAS|nr:hypothetical protein CARUB_v10015077mg [Capsella rubella]